MRYCCTVFLILQWTVLCFVITLPQCSTEYTFYFYLNVLFDIHYEIVFGNFTSREFVIKSERIVYTRCIVFGYFLEIPLRVNCCYFWWSSSPLGKVWTNGEESRRYRHSFYFITCWLVSDIWTASLKLKVKFYRCFHFMPN